MIIINWIGLFFNNALPGSVGGDIVKSYYICKSGYSFVNILFISFLDRVCGLYGLLLNFLVGFPSLFTKNRIIFYIFAGIYLGICTISISILLSRWFQNVISAMIKKVPFIREYHDSVFLPFLDSIKRPFLFLPPILISVITHIFLIYMFWTATLFWQEYNQHKFLNFFSIVPVGFLITALPISISGWGTGDAGFGFMYKTFGYPIEVGVGVSILYKFTLLILSIPGFIFWIYKFFKR